MVEVENGLTNHMWLIDVTGGQISLYNWFENGVRILGHGQPQRHPSSAITAISNPLRAQSGNRYRRNPSTLMQEGLREGFFKA